MRIVSTRGATLRVWSAAAGVLAVGLLLGACQSDGENATDPETSATPDPSPTEDEPVVEEADVLAAYQRFWEVKGEMYAEPTVHSEELSTYAHGQALEDVRDTAFYYVDAGTRMTGEPVLSPEVTSLDVDADPPTAEIEDCVDSSEYIQVDADGDPVETVNDQRRHLVTSTLTELDGSWKVTDSDIDRDSSC